MVRRPLPFVIARTVNFVPVSYSNTFFPVSDAIASTWYPLPASHRISVSAYMDPLAPVIATTIGPFVCLVLSVIKVNSLFYPRYMKP